MAGAPGGKIWIATRLLILLERHHERLRAYEKKIANCCLASRQFRDPQVIALKMAVWVKFSRAPLTSGQRLRILRKAANERWGEIDGHSARKSTAGFGPSCLPAELMPEFGSIPM